MTSPPRLIPLEPLTPAAFAPYGTVIQNPTVAPPASPAPPPISANQGSATKFPAISPLDGFYHLAASNRPSAPKLAMFSCRPRPLRAPSAGAAENGQQLPPGTRGLFDVKILERHPYTTQTFVPLATPAHGSDTAYLVIVAPTRARTSKSDALARPKPYPVPEKKAAQSKHSKEERSGILASIFGRARPSPFDNSRAPPPGVDARGAAAALAARPKRLPRGSGPPDLGGLRAFIARGDQAVTYGAGTWHAPMAVVGGQIDFVVVQYMNGVAGDDVQEYDFGGQGDEVADEIAVVVGSGDGLESVKAKL